MANGRPLQEWIPDMKRILIFALFNLYSSSLLAGNGQKYPGVPDSLANKFEDNVKVWREAYNGGDAANLIPLYAEEAEYISGHVDGLVASGRSNVVAYFQQGIDMGGHIDDIEIQSVSYSCDLAVLFCKYQATNAGEKASGRNMLVLRKIGSRWLIIRHMTVV